MAYSDSFPAVRPVFQADFANGGKIDPRATYTRSTTGTFFGTAKHLSSDNLLLQSSDFDTTWEAEGLLSTPSGGQTDPSGSTNGWRLTEANTTDVHRVKQQNLSASGTVAYTVYAKRNSGSRALMLKLFNVSTGWVVGVFDLAGGAALTTASGGSGFTSVSVSQTSSGNGYYKCVIKATGTVPFVSIALKDAADTSGLSAIGTRTYAGDGTSSIDVAFASLTTTGATDYNATTTQIHREYAPTLQTAAINAPRFEYSTDGESMGILIEGQSSNLFLRSESIGSSSWVKFRSNRDADVAVAPDGTLTADKLREDSSASDSHGIYQDFTVSSATAYTVSVFAKADGRSHFAIRFDPNNGIFANDFAFFNLSTGATGTTDSDITSSIQDCGNGWFRCIATRTTLASGLGRVVFYLADADNSTSYTGNKYSGVLLWGAMAEESSHASSYIKTEAATATRAADSLSVDLSAINHDPIGTDIALATEFRCNVVDTTFRRIAEMRMSSGSGLHNSHVIYNGYAYSYATDTSAVNQTLKSIANLGDTSHKLVSTQSGATAFAAGDGVAGNTKSSTAKDMIYDRLYIGSDSAGIRQLDGHISRVALYGNSISETNATALSK